MKPLRELEEIELLLDLGGDLVRGRVLAEVSLRDGRRLPVRGLVIGPDDPSLPTLGLVGGIHGLERIGTQVVLAYLYSLLEGLRWDVHLRRRFETCRIVAVPLANPGGMVLQRRSNPNGVDLMRNAPHVALERAPWPMGGQRLSRWLPWYRGREGQPMEPEARAVCEFVEAELFSARAGLVLDVHSGFGVRDRLWYPYAKKHGGFPRAAEARNLATLLECTYPQHRYLIEPQASAYVSHGDLWDHLFDRHLARHGVGGPVFLPWTLEMGSWTWVRKNPRQLLRLAGPFNPIVPHRLRRVMRHHLLLCDFFLRATHNPAAWRLGQPG